MKTMTCKQLGGACDMEFHAETFDDMARMSQQHGKEMAEKADKPHLDAMEEMGKMMQDPRAMQVWMQDKQAEFEALPQSSKV